LSAAAVSSAVEARREAREAREQLTAAEQRASEHRALIGSQCGSINDLSRELASTRSTLYEIQAEIAAVRTVMAAERVVAEENTVLIEKLQPQLDALTQARSELTTLCDGVRTRMRRKEQEAEQAILNRGLMAGARPDLNRR
jgi:chromosome segregation ATPase